MKCPKCGDGRHCRAQGASAAISSGAAPTIPSATSRRTTSRCRSQVPGVRQPVPGGEDAEERHLPRVPEQEEERRGRGDRAQEARQKGCRARAAGRGRLPLLEADRRCAASARRRKRMGRCSRSRTARGNCSRRENENRPDWERSASHPRSSLPAPDRVVLPSEKPPWSACRWNDRWPHLLTPKYSQALRTAPRDADAPGTRLDDRRILAEQRRRSTSPWP